MKSYTDPTSTQDEPLPPHDSEAEAGALACVLGFENGEAESALTSLSLDLFYDERNRNIFRALQSLHMDGKHLNVLSLAGWLRDKKQTEEAGGFDYIQNLPDKTPSPENFPDFLESVEACATRRAVVRDALELQRLAENTAIPYKSLADAARRMGESYGAASGKSQLKQLIAACRFNIHIKPPAAAPRYMIGHASVSTPGNITTIYGPPKGAKSAVAGAMMAAAMTTEPEKADCLRFTSRNHENKALIHLDTEQSIADHYNQAERNTRRARLTEPPPWLLSFCLTRFSIDERRAAIPIIIKEAAAEFGGIHSLILDGVADFVTDVNNTEESNEFVNELHGLAIKCDCPIICVIHLNPGTEKTRGHLGSQLERKAETNLRLERDGEAIVVWSEKNRGAPILKANGPRFIWSDELKMHVGIESAGVAKTEAEAGLLRLEAESVFGLANKGELRWGEFLPPLMSVCKIKESGARKRMEKMVRAQIIAKDLVGFYRLKP